MSRNFIERLKANQEPWSNFPIATDANARVILQPNEKILSETIRVNSVGSSHHFIYKGDSEWRPSDATLGKYGLVSDSRWELTVTDKRIIFWLPTVSNIFGKMKEKPGRATGGCLLFKEHYEIDRDGELWLAFRLDIDSVVTDSVGLEIEFRSEKDARQFSSLFAEQKSAGLEGEGYKYYLEMSQLRCRYF
jgi:hypothetical protein